MIPSRRKREVERLEADSEFKRIVHSDSIRRGFPSIREYTRTVAKIMKDRNETSPFDIFLGKNQ